MKNYQRRDFLVRSLRERNPMVIETTLRARILTRVDMIIRTRVLPPPEVMDFVVGWYVIKVMRDKQGSGFL